MDEQAGAQMVIRPGVRWSLSSLWCWIGGITLTLLLITGVVGCTSGDEESVEPPTTTESAELSAKQVVETVESLQPNSPIGFDPEVWSAAEDQSRVLPAGSTVEVVDGTTVVEADEATIDVVVTSPGGAPQRSWLFLRRVDGEWLVYGSLPLEVTE